MYIATSPPPAMMATARTPSDTPKAAFAVANVTAEVTVYDGTIHGWTVRDMPQAGDGKPILQSA